MDIILCVSLQKLSQGASPDVERLMTSFPVWMETVMLIQNIQKYSQKNSPFFALYVNLLFI